MKFLVSKYYVILFLVLIYFIFNVTVRDSLINWIFNTPTDKSVVDAAAYAKATKVRNLFSYILVACLAFTGIFSMILLFVPEGKEINRWILISVSAIIAILFLGILSIGGFS